MPRFALFAWTGTALFLSIFLPVKALSQVLINEVSNANYNVIRDEYGEYRDWIELINTDTAEVNLEGYCLSDDSTQMERWCFPEYLMGPGEHLVVFASGKNIGSPPVYWQTVIREGEVWRYILPDADTPGNWFETGFQDSSWNTGPTGIGYSDGDDATQIPTTLAVYLRKTFEVEDPSRVKGCLLQIDYDDAFVAYINGKEIARAGIAGFPPAYDQTASSSHEARMYGGGDPQKFNVAGLEGLILPGENVLAVEVHNISAGSSDMTAIPFLSLQSDQKPDSVPPDILGLSTTYFHTDFKLDKEGEPLYLMDEQGIFADSVHIPWIGENNSYGRNPGDPDSWVTYWEPTPGAANSGEYFQGYLDRLPDFSIPGGRFGESFQLSLSSVDAGDSIYYTLDGSEPTDGSSLYTVPFQISANSVVRARIIRAGYPPGRLVTQTYFTGDDNQLPVLCITSDPYNLWDENYGIYAKGPNAQNSFPYFDANFWQDWERPAHLEFYEEDGTLGFSMGTGIKIYGGWTRGNEQKSLAMFARRQYGTRKLVYPLFSNRPFNEYESFIIRNSGNDWFGQGSESGTQFRDMMMTRLTRDMDVEYLESRQAVIYINGEYWGVENLREKVNEHFIAANNGVDPDRIDMLEGNQYILHGDNSHYADLISFINSNPLQLEENYAYAERRVDIQNFINYQISEIYFDNQDWPGNNLKYWRPATPNGKWRWILYDTDFGFGLWDANKVFNNTLEFATEPNGPVWPNPSWATFLLRKFLTNQEFREGFINSFCDRINTSFSRDSVSSLVNRLRDNIDEEMINHAARWGGSYQTWVYRCNEVISFGQQRPAIVRNQIRDYFGLGSLASLSVDVNTKGRGFIKLNSMFLRKFPFNGIYFEDVPVELTAIPRPGYRFAGWTGGVSSDAAFLRVNLGGGLTLQARFEPDPVNQVYPVLINEVCYTSDTLMPGGDWIELYNAGDQYVDVSGWIIKDSDSLHTYEIRPGTILEPREYYVLCNDRLAFETAYPQVMNYQAEFGFGLDNDQDMIRLYTGSLQLVDSVSYSNLYPWPVILPGTGYTMSLINADSDNALPGSWERSKEWLGTPGARNSQNVGMPETAAGAEPDYLFQNRPNPFSAETRIVFYSGKDQEVAITVYDLNGRVVDILADERLTKGRHEFLWTPEDPASELYILRVVTQGSVFSRKMTRFR